MFISAAAFLLFFSSLAFANPLTISFLDVGEGSATVVQDGQAIVLIDSGNPKATFKLNAFLEKVVKETAPLHIITTHPHQDHIGGIFFVSSKYPLARFYDNGQPVDLTIEPYRWYVDVVRNTYPANYRKLAARDSIHLHNSRITVLSPTEERLDEDWNKNSLVLRLDYGRFCALFMADALHATEEKLLRDAALHLQCPIVQVGHHGSSFASSLPFVQRVKAKEAIISSNEKNVRGYPAESTIKRWKESGSHVLTTMQHGDISIVPQKDGSYAIKTER